MTALIELIWPISGSWELNQLASSVSHRNTLPRTASTLTKHIGFTLTLLWCWQAAWMVWSARWGGERERGAECGRQYEGEKDGKRENERQSAGREKTDEWERISLNEVHVGNTYFHSFTFVIRYQLEVKLSSTFCCSTFYKLLCFTVFCQTYTVLHVSVLNMKKGPKTMSECDIVRWIVTPLLFCHRADSEELSLSPESRVTIT